MSIRAIQETRLNAIPKRYRWVAERYIRGVRCLKICFQLSLVQGRGENSGMSERLRTKYRQQEWWSNAKEQPAEGMKAKLLGDSYDFVGKWH